MISEDLQNMADRLSSYALTGRAIEPEVAGCMALALLDHARVVAVLETLPFDVTLELISELPEYPLLRAATESQQPSKIRARETWRHIP